MSHTELEELLLLSAALRRVLSRPAAKSAPTRFEKLAALSAKEVTIKEEVSRTTIVSGKWKFRS